MKKIINWLRYKGILSLQSAFEVVCLYSDGKPTELEAFQALANFTEAVLTIPADGYISRNLFFATHNATKNQAAKRKKAKRKQTQKARKCNR